MDARSPRLSTWLQDALALVLPVSCAACGEPDRRLCAACRAQLEPEVCLLGVAVETSTLLTSTGPSFTVASAGPYTGPLVEAVHALKEEHRTGIARDLAFRLSASVDHLMTSVVNGTASARDILFVAPPSSRANFQARGFEPIELLARHAKIPLSRELRAVRARVDQTGLGASERDDNVRGSLIARRPLVGASVILIDDLVTTGATLREMNRALCAAGARVLGAATLAHTPRRFPSRPKA